MAGGSATVAALSFENHGPGRQRLGAFCFFPSNGRRNLLSCDSSIEAPLATQFTDAGLAAGILDIRAAVEDKTVE